MRQSVNWITALAFVGAVSATTSQAATPAAAVENEIRKLDADWEMAVNARDAAKVASFYADDAYGLANHRPLAVGKKAIALEWQRVLATPDLRLHWQPIHIGVSRSRDVAYDVGSYTLSMTDPTGKAVNVTGKYVVVWKKATDSRWRIAVDISNPNS
jgi:uncharacterized protein (TIGR02246 family)